MFADLTTVNADIRGENEVLLANKCSSNDIWQKDQQVVSVDNFFRQRFACICHLVMKRLNCLQIELYHSVDTILSSIVTSNMTSKAKN